MNLKKILLSILLIINYLYAFTQCIAPPSSDNCGIVNARGGVDGDPVFCGNSAVNFQNQSTGGVDSTYYCWGDGQTTVVAGTASASHYFVATGTECSKRYQIIMTIVKRCTINNVIQRSTHSLTSEITIRSNPDANFALTTANSVANTPILLRNASLCITNGCIWDFGDGMIDTTNCVTTSHTYQTAGDYRVTLYVFNACVPRPADLNSLLGNGGVGAGTKTRDLTVYKKPVIKIKLPTRLCTSDTLLLENLSENVSTYNWTITPITPNARWRWLNSGSNDPSPSIAFVDTGRYRIKIRMKALYDEYVEWDTLVQVGAAPIVALRNITRVCDTLWLVPQDIVTYTGGVPTKYAWFFQNNVSKDTSYLRHPNRRLFGYGEHGVAVRAENQCGIAEARVDFQVIPPPTASFLATIDSICLPARVSIHATTSNVTQFQWNVQQPTVFIEGTTSDSANPILRFTEGGSYRIRGTFIGCHNVMKDTILTIIDRPIVNLIPVLDDCGQITVTPSAMMRYDSNWIWRFTGGNRDSSILKQPETIRFSAPMNIIQVTASNICGSTTVSDTFSLRHSDSIVIINPPRTLCNSAGVTTFQATPAGGFWSGSNINRIGMFDPRHAPIGLNTLVYQYGDRQCIIQASVIVEVSGTPVQSGTDFNTCSNLEPIQLTGQLPAIGRWSGSGITDAISGLFSPASAGTGVHPLVYTVTHSATGCVNTATRYVTVHPAPVARLAPFALKCMDSDIRFQGTSTGFDQIQWQFGDHQTSPLLTPTHRYAASGEYRVQLKVTTLQGCADSMSQNVKILQKPRADFTADTLSGCGPLLPIFFTNRSQGDSLRYLWDFNTPRQDNTRDILDAVLFPQASIGTTLYEVRLTATNICGASTKVDTVKVHPHPGARFGIQPRNTCSPMVVDIANASVGYPTRYDWDFGNGNRSTASTIAPQTYLATGDRDSTYTLTLIVGNTCGTDTLRRTIRVEPPRVKAFFTIDNTVGCAPFTVRCVNYSTAGSHARWTTGEPTGVSVASTDFTHTYTQAGTYTITLYAESANRCGYDTIQRTITVNSNASPQIMVAPNFCVGDTIKPTLNNMNYQTLRWSFGNQNSSTHVAEHVYSQAGTYTIVMNGNTLLGNCPVRATANVLIRPKPVAHFTLDKTDGCPPLKVAFRNASTLAGSAIAPPYTVWKWTNLTNRSSSSSIELNPTHQFDTSGIYTVHLKVIDPYGCADSFLYAPITVHPLPKAQFDLAQDRYCGLPISTQFNDKSTGASGCEWQFGDGTPISRLQTPTHLYQNEGIWQVRLIASNAFLCRDTITKSIEAYQKPIADFEVLPIQGCSPLRVTFRDKSIHAVGKRTLYFGDGKQLQVDSFPSMPYTYTIAGNYSPKLLVSNGARCKDSLTLTNQVEVLERPVADFISRDSNDSKPNGILIFTNQSVHAHTYKWILGDNKGVTTVENPQYRYLQSRAYPVTLQVANRNGCNDSVTKIVTPQFFSGLYVPNVMSIGASTEGMKHFLPKGTMLKTYQLSIYSTYGKLLWYSDRLEQGQPVDFWDGTLNGETLPQDVYVWKIQATFEDGSVWRGMCDDAGRCSNIGTITILR